MDDLFNLVFKGNIFDNIIIKKISLKDAYKLSLVNLTLFKRMNEEYFIRIMRNKIETKLREILGINFLPFIKKLNRVRGVISGSFIHQCILDELYENSDIDIYVGNKKSDEELNSYIKTISVRSSSDYNGMYKAAFSCMRSITDHYIDNKHVLDEQDIILVEKLEEYRDYYIIPENIKTIKNKIKEKCTKIQVVSIKTNKDYQLWDHIKNTGFDVCKNMLYYDDNLNLQLRLFNIREIMFKRSTFIIQNIDDFYYRIEKYSKRGYQFKPKYNKLLYLEYLYLKFSHRHLLKTNFDERKFKELEGKKCGVNCPIKLLFNDTRHYHTETHDDNEIYNVIKITTVENDGTFNRILPQLMSVDKDPLSRRNLRIAVYRSHDLNEYAKVRNNFTKHPINIYSRANDYKYDVSYNKPCNFIKKAHITNRKTNNKTNNKELKKEWKTIKSKK